MPGSPGGLWRGAEQDVDRNTAESLPLVAFDGERIIQTGELIPVSRPENGIEGDFVVIDILPCPTPAKGDGQLVTTKFIHEDAEVYDLKVEGSSETIGTTAGHQFWSEDRQDFVPISEFQVGEQLELADGTLSRLESLRARNHLETVYNIEIDGEHVYRVGSLGALVHNACRKRYITYRGIDPATGKTYVGRASGPARLNARQILDRRLAGHHRIDTGKVIDQVTGSANRNGRAYKAIRGREQELMDHFRRKGELTTQIRGISEKNLKLPRGKSMIKESRREFGAL